VLTFVWDIDDVLNDLMQSWFAEEWLPAHPECRVTYSGLLQNPPHRVLGISIEEYFASLDAFRLSEKARRMQPNLSILQWFQAHGARHRHMALTARPLETTPPLAEWLFRHFGSYLRNFGVVPTRIANGAPRYDNDKGDYLRWFGRADCLIDDSEENIAAARSLGIGSVLYPQPWNSGTATVDDTLRRLAALAEAN